MAILCSCGLEVDWGAVPVERRGILLSEAESVEASRGAETEERGR